MSKKIKLKSSDGETFEVDEAVALESQVIKDMIELDCADGSIPLPNVTGAILARVIEYCKKHVESGSSSLTSTSTTSATSSITEPSKSTEDELKVWDAGFIKVDPNTLSGLIAAANYLNIKSLLDLTRQTVEDLVKGMTPDEIRKTFNIKNDFTLKSKEGNPFKVDEAVAVLSLTIKDKIESQTIKHVIELDWADGIIPLPTVTSTILAMVIKYCKKHVESGSSSSTSTTSSISEPLKSTEDELKAWDAEFVKVDRNTLFDLILAAQYLNIKSLLDFTCQTVADMIKGKTPGEIKRIFNIKNKFTPEEEEEVRRENQWAFE